MLKWEAAVPRCVPICYKDMRKITKLLTHNSWFRCSERKLGPVEHEAGVKSIEQKCSIKVTASEIKLIKNVRISQLENFKG